MTCLSSEYQYEDEEAKHTSTLECCNDDSLHSLDVINEKIGDNIEIPQLDGFHDSSLNWVSSYLSERSQSVCIDGIMSPSLKIKTGVPQGSILGPLYYIIFTNELPEVICNCGQLRIPEASQNKFNMDCSKCGSLCCFADDSTLSLASNDPEELSTSLSDKFRGVSEFLNANRLKLNEEKTQLLLMSTAARKRSQNVHIEIQTSTGTVNEVPTAKLLGINIYEDMKWADYIVKNEDSLIKSLNRRLIGLKKVCRYSDFKTRLMVGNGIVASKLIYLIPLWGGAEAYLIKMLQVVQNKAARYITKKGPEVASAELLKECGWLSVMQLAAYHSLVILHKTLTVHEPTYLYGMYNVAYPRETRLASSGSIRISGTYRVNLSLTMSSFKWRIFSVYNQLPLDVKKQTSMNVFKKHLKQWVQQNIGFS